MEWNPSIGPIERADKVNEVSQFLKQELKEGETVIVGVSGGPDSMALLSLLSDFRKTFSFEIVCAHVNHNVRKESEEEKEFVKEFCKERNILFEYYKIEHYGDDNFHNEARTIRYQFFEHLIQKYHAKYLMTAHHADDLMETILMRITRGSTLKGYSGFSKVVQRKDYQILRPLLSFTKEDILKYLKEKNISYVVDGSNEKDVYTRNRYRKYMLPVLKKESPKVHEKFYKFSQTLLEYQDYVEKEVNEKYHNMYQNYILDLNLFEKEALLIQKNILCKMLEDYYQDDLMLITDIHVELILKLIQSKKNTFICLPNEVIARKEYDKLVMEKKAEKSLSYEMELEQTVLLPNGGKIEVVNESECDNNNICRLSFDEVTFPLIVRTKKIGDKMEVKGMNGSKKVKDIFIDEKLPLHERELFPIVTDSENKIVWLPGLKKSKFDKTKTEKYDIIFRYDSGRRNI